MISGYRCRMHRGRRYIRFLVLLGYLFPASSPMPASAMPSRDLSSGCSPTDKIKAKPWPTPSFHRKLLQKRTKPLARSNNVSATSTNLPSAGPVVASRSFVSRLRDGDEIARLATFLCAASVVLITVLLVFELWIQSALARHKFGFSFFLTRVWDPVAEQFGALPFIYGTLITAGVALFLAVPLGIGAAIFLAELAPLKLSDPLQFLIDLLAAVPSVIYGFLGFFVRAPLMRDWIEPALKNSLGFLPLFQGPAYGIGFLTAGIVLAIMVIPYIISVSREGLLSVPRDQRDAALALGSTRWYSTWKAVAPFATP